MIIKDSNDNEITQDEACDIVRLTHPEVSNEDILKWFANSANSAIHLGRNYIELDLGIKLENI